MNSLTIYSTKTTKVIKALQNLYDVEFTKKPTLLSNIFGNKTQNVDLYFYDSKLDKYNITLLNNAKLIIVNSNKQKEYLLGKVPSLDNDKIKIIYPYIDIGIGYDKDIKKDFKKEYNIDKKTKIIFFRANNLSKNGIKQFLSIVSNLNENNFIVVIESLKNEIEQLKLQLQLIKKDFRIILIEDYKNKAELFMISDIFVFPSSAKFFNADILKAQFYKNGVFVSQNNYASEVVDTFATIELDDEITTRFKIDALLSNPKELKKIKQENFENSLEYSFSKYFNTLQGYLNQI